MRKGKWYRTNYEHYTSIRTLPQGGAFWYTVVANYFLINCSMLNLTHHATLFVHQDRKGLTEKFWNELRANSPAHILHEHTVLDIDTARILTSWANSAYDGERIALLSFHTITLPAQNALLKAIEEPPAGVRFILITTNIEALIPTLLSRVALHSFVENKDMGPLARISPEVTTFLATPYAERMKLPFIIELITRTDEEDRKDREGVRSFILDLARELSLHKEHSSHVLLTLETASYAGDSSSSGKALLEYLSLLWPQIKA